MSKNREYRTNEATEETKKEKLEIVVEEHPEFPSVGHVSFMTSTEICGIANKMLSATFADFYGTKFIVNQNGQMYLEAYFSHLKFDDDTVVGVSLFEEDGSKVSNEMLARIKRQSRRLRQGDKYVLTQNCKDALEKFMMNIVKNQANRKINWESLYCDASEPGDFYRQGSGLGQRELTKISFIDPAKIITEWYGQYMNKEEATENKVEYTVAFKQSLASPVQGMGQVSTNYLLKVEAVEQCELDNVLKKMGVANYNSLGIVQATY